MRSVMAHPLWWPAPQRLAFLIGISDRVEGEDRAVSGALADGVCCASYLVVVGVCCASYLVVVVGDRNLPLSLLVVAPPASMLCLMVSPRRHAAVQEDRTMYQALECCAQDAIGPGGSWAAHMDSGLVNNLGKEKQSRHTLVSTGSNTGRWNALASSLRITSLQWPLCGTLPDVQVLLFAMSLPVSQASTASTATQACVTCCGSSETSTTISGPCPVRGRTYVLV